MEQKVWPCLELRRLFIDYLILKKIKTEWISRVLWGRKDVDLNRLPTVGLNSWQHKILVMKLSAHQGFGVDWEPDYKGVAQGNSVCMDSGGGYTVATHVRKWDTVSHGIFPCSAQTFPVLGELQ